MIGTSRKPSRSPRSYLNQTSAPPSGKKVIQNMKGWSPQRIWMLLFVVYCFGHNVGTKFLNTWDWPEIYVSTTCLVYKNYDQALAYHIYIYIYTCIYHIVTNWIWLMKSLVSSTSSDVGRTSSSAFVQHEGHEGSNAKSSTSCVVEHWTTI